jgi:hypothetical protein
MTRSAVLVIVCVLAACTDSSSPSPDTRPPVDRAVAEARVDRAPSKPDAAPPATKYCIHTSGGGGSYPCATESDCTPHGLHCDTANKICGKCVTDAHCVGDPTGPFCGNAAGTTRYVCLKCRADKDCVAGSGSTAFCELLHGTCNACQTDTECVSAKLGTRCAGSPVKVCRDCLTDADCVKGPGDTGICLQNDCVGCAKDQDCRDAKIGGFCLASVPAGQGYCLPCAIDADCVKGVGATGRCYDHECEGCDTDAECALAFPEKTYGKVPCGTLP